MHAAVRGNRGLAPAVKRKDGVAVEPQSPHVVVRVEVKLLVAAVRAENDFGVINNRPHRKASGFVQRSVPAGVSENTPIPCVPTE